jgi:hypothetical protein
VIISHSPLFYWWPVWLTGFVMAILTAADGHFMAIVPKDTVAAKSPSVKLPDDGDTLTNREVLIAPKDKELTRKKGSQEPAHPDVRMAESRNYGILFVVVLLMVVFITNVPLRGLWSLLIIVVILLLSIIFAQAGIWDKLIQHAGMLDVHINLGGYILISVVVLILWLINFLFFDRQFYMIFTPGQVRVHLEIGAGETVYGTEGMIFQKQRSDLFRHWILGFGSGDLIVRPAGGTQHIDLPNVLAVGRRVRQIEKKLAEKEVVQAK